MSGRIYAHIRGNVVGYVAVFLALTGVTWAATAPRNSVGTKAIKKGAVKTKKIASGAVTEPKIAADAVTGAQIAPDAVSSASVAPDSLTGANIDQTTFNRNLLQFRVDENCPSGEAISSIGSGGQVSCQSTGSGTITGVTAGFGLTGGGTSGNVELDGDTDELQARVEECPSGETLNEVLQNGQSICLDTVSQITQVNGSNGDNSNEAVATCPAGATVIGGGGSNTEPVPANPILESFPNVNNWTVFWEAPQDSGTLMATAICAS